MNTVLVQELERFNNLLAVIMSSLKSIISALKGEVLLSEQLESVYNSLLIQEVPAMWLKHSYPSLKPLGSYIRDFCLRLQTFEQWIEEGPPHVFWISGFYFPQSFLTGILQNYARRYKVEIDTLNFDFEMMQSDPTNYETEVFQNSNISGLLVPEDGALVSGMFFEGAAWNYKSKLLDESEPKKLFASAPIVWLKPMRISKINHENVYECPLYKTAERKGTLLTTGHSTNFILNVRVPTEEPAEHWVKRGVALLCQLSH